MTPLENMMLGRVPKLWKRLDTRSFESRATALSERYGLSVDLRRKISDLSIGERQRVEVLKCLLEEPKLLVLDEPTAVLPPREVQSLLDVVRRVATGGCGVLLVTHKLAEIRAVADRTSVLRRGKVIETVSMADADLPSLVRAMVGREVKPLTEAADRSRVLAAGGGPAALTLSELTAKDDAGVVRLEVSLTVGAGEIVGLAGVEGNGQSELGDILAGLRKPDGGAMHVGGEEATGKAPRELSALGVGIVPEDRHATGCHLDLDVAENLFLDRLGDFSRFGLLNRKRLAAEAAARIDAFDVRGNARMRFGDLSGGNQQKVVLARELGKEPLRFLLAAQPTRGLDVGAVEAVYAHLRAARDRGVGVLLVSSELEEVLSVADRVLVIYRGRIVGEVPGDPREMERVGTLMSGRFLKEIAS
jgi:simple sugar transport system ATP-binding protein